jgi:plasmid stabilization system protein ParE
VTVYWTNEALEEVAEIRDYLLENAPSYAEQIIASFFEQAEQLSNFPKMGRPYRKGELPQIRELLVGTYRITYYVGLNQLDIMTVRHQAQNR